jgi:hypothetical protein
MRLPRSKPKIMGVPVSIDTAKDLARATRDVFKRRFVPEDVKQLRMSICQDCEHWDKRSHRCTECGCQMKVKTTLTSSRCPLNKWGPHIEDMRE